MIGVTGRVAEILRKADCPYVVTGGVALVYYGVMRMTYDVDFMTLTVSGSKLDKLLRLMKEEGFDFNGDKSRRILKGGGIVRFAGARGIVEGFVVDLIAKEEIGPILKRSIVAKGEGRIRMISPEDLIVEKLSVIKDSPPSKPRPQDKEDVLALLAIEEEINLNMAYLRRRSKKEKVDGLLGKFLEKAREIADMS